MTEAAPFKVLFVCTGNICRSAFAEVLCRQLFDDRLGALARPSFAFSSAGVAAVVGSGIHPLTREVLGLWGPSLYQEADRFVARPLRGHMLRWADLVLTAEDQHRTQIAWTAPEATGKLFTMVRFGRIIGRLDPNELPPDPVARARAAVRAAAGSTEPVRPDDDSVPDPIGGPPQAHLRSADLVFEAMGSFVDLVAPLS